MRSLDSNKKYKQEKKEAKSKADKKKKLAKARKAPSKKKKWATRKRKSGRYTWKTKWKLVKILDTWFSRYIRLRDSKNGIITCITCWSRIPRKKSHACHFINRWNYKYRRDEKNVNAGCNYCNTYNQFEHMRKYTLRMIDKFGRDYVDELHANKRDVAGWWRHEIIEKIEHYKQKVKAMQQ